MTSVPLVATCEDPALFNVALWPRQRELMAELDSARIHVWSLGRRSGKSTMAAMAALHSCLFRPDLDALVRPGELRYAVVVATNQAQGRLIVQAARSIVERSPLLAKLVTRQDVDGMEFVTASGARSALVALPCNSRGARGWPISLLFLDEAAHMLSSDGSEQAAERVWQALVPATAQFGDLARIIVASTPWGDAGLFAELFAKAHSGELSGAVARQFSTAEMNPTITAAFLDTERQRDPVAFDSEYGARFIGGGAAFIDMERVQVADHRGLPPDAASQWIAGLDPAFTNDLFGVALVGVQRSGAASRLVVGDVVGLRPQRADSFAQRRDVEDHLLAQVVVACRRYRASAITDQYQSRAVADRLTSNAIAVRTHTMSAASKTAIFTELRARLYDGSLELPAHPGLLAELRRLRTRWTAGSAAVVNPRVAGSHGDMAQALALAVFEHAQRGIAAGHVRGGVTTSGFGNLLAAAPGDMAPPRRGPATRGAEPPDPTDPIHAERRSASVTVGLMTAEL
jgi:hypothetical protein